MNLYEEIYTSSAELLDGGSGNLGVVARTRGFPSELESELSAYRSYTFLADLPIGLVHLHPLRISVAMCGQSRRYLLLSQTVFAGADHTGRTRPLSHQVLIKFDEIERARASVASLAAAVFPLMLKTWTEKPSWIDPPRAIALPNRVLEASRSLAWPNARDLNCNEVLLIAIADALITFPQSGRAIVICLPKAKVTAALELAIELLSLLPRSIQSEIPIASHIVDVSDYPRNGALLFTYPNTPFLAHTIDRRDPRKPVLFDLTQAEREPCQDKGPYAQTLAQSGEPYSLLQIVRMAGLWDDWGFTSAEAAIFPNAYELNDALASTSDPAKLVLLGPSIQKVRCIGNLSTSVDQWCSEIIDRLNRSAADSRWEAMAAIHIDHRWPESARARALSSICVSWELSLPYLLARQGFPTITDEQYLALLAAIVAQPNVVEHSLAAAAIETTQARLEFAQAVCEHMPWNFERVTKCLGQLSAAPQPTRKSLRAALLRKAAVNVRRVDEVASLCRPAIDQVAGDTEYGCAVCELVLRPHVQRAKPGPTLDHLCKLLMETSDSCRRTTAELQWLRDCVGLDQISPQLVEQWTRAIGEAERIVSPLSPPLAVGVSVFVPVARSGETEPANRHWTPPRLHATRRGLSPISWLFPACILAAFLSFLLFVGMSIPWPSGGFEGLKGHESQALLLTPLLIWIVFEIALRFLFQSQWRIHAIGRILLLIAMAGSIGWIGWIVSHAIGSMGEA